MAATKARAYAVEDHGCVFTILNFHHAAHLAVGSSFPVYAHASTGQAPLTQGPRL